MKDIEAGLRFNENADYDAQCAPLPLIHPIIEHCGYALDVPSCYMRIATVIHPPHWSYYMSLEDDLIKTGHYVDICEDNFDTYSTQFTRLLLAAGSEVDVVAKQVCLQISPHGTYGNIEDYRETIVPKYPAIPCIEMDIQWTNIRVKPWDSWANTAPSSPDWWRAYNKVKHERNNNFKEANLRNALTAIAALYCLVRLLQQDAGRPRPERFLRFVQP